MDRMRSRGGSERSLEAEFEHLYRENFEKVHAFVLSRMSDVETARDVTSEAFLRAARNFARFDPARAKFSTWVIAIARNCMIDHFRKVRMDSPIEEAPDSVLIAHENIEQNATDADLVRRLMRVVEPDEREILYLKYYAGMRNSEIAQEKNMNASTVATKLQRALAKMRSAAESQRTA